MYIHISKDVAYHKFIQFLFVNYTSISLEGRKRQVENWVREFPMQSELPIQRSYDRQGGTMTCSKNIYTHIKKLSASLKNFPKENVHIVFTLQTKLNN